MQHIPKSSRYTLGGKIDSIFVELIELLFKTLYSSNRNVETLESAIAKLDTLKILIQLSWESKLIATTHFTKLIEQLGEIGKMLYGWKRNIETGFPAKNMRGINKR
ncbi:four helix bundle protein [Candidatus Parcubacteria bacterium]|jgi:hypothetical protein|nr:MAG: four helix bundle protein [Candidatus Parcubacteria bacterium]